MGVNNVSGKSLTHSTGHTRMPFIARTVFLCLFILAGVVSSNVAANPLVTDPLPGNPISSSTETFQWSANGESVSEWWLYVGTSVGGNEIHDSGSLSSSTYSATVSSLPVDGSTVWVRLWYDSDYWHYIDFQYSAAMVTGNNEPAIPVPAPGAQLSGETATFQWTANGESVSEWWLYVGTSVGGNEIHDSGSLSSSTYSATVSSLPVDGNTVWVRLWYDSDYWHYIDFQYSAAMVTGNNEPAITVPAPDAQLSGETATFQWSANGAVVSNWTLTAGASIGGSEYYDSGALGAGTLSATASGLPTDGSAVWVRLVYVTDQVYSVDYLYTAAVVTGAPGITVPAPGTQLNSETATFQWTANGESVSEWWLYVGTSVGGSEIHDSGSLSSSTYSATVSSLPVDGNTVWVRLWYDSDYWHYIDFQYSAAMVTGNNEPAITVPAPDAQLSGETATFQWSANGAVVSNWTLTAGASIGGSEYYDSGALGAGTLSATASGLPTDGSAVRVRLKYVTDQVYSVDYLYTAAVVTGAPAITVPVPGTQLNSETATFQWSANGESVSEWWLYVGTSVGGNEIHDSGSLSSSTYSATVSSLPVDGSTVWVRLWFVSDYWHYIDFQYSAATAAGNNEPAITVPVPGTQLNSETATFQWTANGEIVSEWWLYVGTSVGGNEIHDSGSLSSSTYSATVSNLPVDGNTVWVRLWYDSDYWHYIDFQYTANNNGIWMVSPVQNELMTQTDVDVQATATGFPQNWSVEFVVDNQLGNVVQGSLVQGTSMWTASLRDLSKMTHVLMAVMVDETGVKQFGFSHEITFDVGDYYVAFGDSISQGIGDDISYDNQSMDGRNSSTGYTPILNDLLTASKGYPHNVAVQGINGYTSADGLLDIDAALAAHPESSHFMIQFGTNDSDPGHPVPSGLNKRDGDSGYPGTFKDNMQRLINAVHASGKIALLAKAPIRYGDCSGNTGTYTCDSYVQRGILPPEDATANGFVREYNLVVDELIQENGLELDPIGSPGVLFIAPDLYTYFNVPVLELDGEGKSSKFSDWLHPNGEGYQDMANLWLQSLVP